MNQPLLLVIDVDPGIRLLVSEIADLAGYASVSAGNPVEIRLALERSPDVIVLDLSMADMDGIEVLWALRERRSRAAILISSGFIDPFVNSAVVYAENSGLNFIGRLDKPYFPESMMAILAKIVAPNAESESTHV